MGIDPIIFVVDVTIQPPPLCRPTNITNSSVMACLERNGISQIHLDCSLMLNIPVMKLRSYSNGTMMVLSSTSEIIACYNRVWPTSIAMGKMYINK